MRKVGPEAARSYQRRLENGFFDRYLAGANILDIGFAGGDPECLPIVESAIGIGLDYPGYDGLHLPFADHSQDTVFASHCYEHIAEYKTVLREWYRVLRVGGYLVVLVPHKYLYERKSTPPSLFNADHKRFYTAAALLREFEESLPVNGFRVRHLADNDEGFDYRTPIGEHAHGCYEIELVVQKIERPSHSDLFELPPHRRAYVDDSTRSIADAIDRAIDGEMTPASLARMAREMPYFPYYEVIRSEIIDNRKKCLDESQLRDFLKPVLDSVVFDESLYLEIYREIGEAIRQGIVGSAREHFINHGYFEGRVFQQDPAWADLPDDADRIGSRQAGA